MQANEQAWHTGMAEKAITRLRRKEAQKQFDHVCMEGTKLENVLCFTMSYLGSNFEADGDCEQDVKIRMAIAKSTFGKLMEIWKAEENPLKQKLRLYSAAVISVVSFGFETWEMPQKLEDSLRGWLVFSLTLGRKISTKSPSRIFEPQKCDWALLEFLLPKVRYPHFCARRLRYMMGCLQADRMNNNLIGDSRRRSATLIN